jgi:hypothetical protein
VGNSPVMVITVEKIQICLKISLLIKRYKRRFLLFPVLFDPKGRKTQKKGFNQITLIYIYAT